MSLHRRYIRLVQPAIYILLVHLAAVVDSPTLAVGALALFCGIFLVSNIVSEGNRWERAGWATATVVMLCLTLLAHRGLTAIASLVLFPPVALGVYVAAMFGRTLLPGNTPLITRFCILAQGREVASRLARYTRTLTAVWTALIGAVTVEVALLAIFADFETWSWLVNIVNPIALTTFFLAEYAYRSRRYSALGPFPLARDLRVMLRPDIWMGADAKHSP